MYLFISNQNNFFTDAQYDASPVNNIQIESHVRGEEQKVY